MLPLAADVARNVVCVLGSWMSCAKTTEPIEIPLGGRLMWVQGRNHLLDSSPDPPAGRGTFGDMGDKTVMRSFAKCL